MALAGLVALVVIGGGDRGLVDSVQHRSSLDSWREHGAYGPEPALAQEAPRATGGGAGRQAVCPSGRCSSAIEGSVSRGLQAISPDQPEPSSALGRDSAIPALIASYTWPYEQAIAVAKCENRNLDPTIISSTNDYGILQINKVHAWRVEGDIMRFLIPEVNVRVAYEIYVDSEGWSPWRSSRWCHGY